MHMLQSLFYLIPALHVSGVTITHLQEHKTTVTTASGNRYNVIDRVKFTVTFFILSPCMLLHSILLLTLCTYLIKNYDNSH